jgi:hypothetical protein
VDEICQDYRYKAELGGALSIPDKGDGARTRYYTGSVCLNMASAATQALRRGTAVGPEEPEGSAAQPSYIITIPKTTRGVGWQLDIGSITGITMILNKIAIIDVF